MAGLTFDASTHTFWRDGTRVLSVTQVLKRCGLTSPWWTEEARARGTRVHGALYDLQRTSDREARELLREGDAPYYNAGVLALQTFGITVLGVEELVDGTSYAGWLDLRCTLAGHDDPWVIDFKSGRAAPWTPIQLAAYAAPFPTYHRRGIIELLPTGKPKLTTCTRGERDLRTFTPASRWRSFSSAGRSRQWQLTW